MTKWVLPATTLFPHRLQLDTVAGGPGAGPG